MIDKATRDKLIAEHPSSAEVIKPFLRGRDVKRWSVDYQNLYLLYIPWHFPLHQDSKITGASEKAEQEFKNCYPSIYNHLLRFKTELSARNKDETGIRYEWYALQRWGSNYWQEFEKPKIVWGNLATSPQFAIASSGFYICAPANLIVSEHERYFLLAILNSQITQYIVSQNAAVRQGGFLEFKPMYVSQIPIPAATEAEQKAIETLVGYVLHLTAALKDIPSVGQGLEQVSADKVMTQYFEKIIDGLVYELYLPEELHAKDKYFMRYLLLENLPNIDKIKGDKMTELRQIFQKLFHKNHPIAKNLFFLDNVEVIRIIEGKK